MWEYLEARALLSGCQESLVEIGWDGVEEVFEADLGFASDDVVFVDNWPDFEFFYGGDESSLVELDPESGELIWLSEDVKSDGHLPESESEVTEDEGYWDEEFADDVYVYGGWEDASTEEVLMEEMGVEAPAEDRAEETAEQAPATEERPDGQQERVVAGNGDGGKDANPNLFSTLEAEEDLLGAAFQTVLE